MGGLAPEAIVPAVVLIAAGGLEMVRGWRAPSTSATRRWIANVTLFGLSFGLGYVMAPLVAAVVALADLHLGLAERIDGTALRVAAAILVLDLLDYTLHRASHGIALLWRVHQPHHSDLELDVTTALRHHPFEAAVTSVALGGGGALLGFAPHEIAIYGAVALSVQLVAHANVALPRGLTDLLAPVLVTPDFHRLHHSRSRAEADANYGQVFSFWDRILGTRRTGNAAEVRFGVDGVGEAASQRLTRLLAQPILRG
ncbi:MAG TPA: sterol desaturase family protein [Stellaceae bacterium]|jgi:sterol desaturase/sphingolipid hydroxylase (fatty acid hydroxylase superfamily)|nr:sterol desaturase family protein [Stellaceae bacterium]